VDLKWLQPRMGWGLPRRTRLENQIAGLYRRLIYFESICDTKTLGNCFVLDQGEQFLPESRDCDAAHGFLCRTGFYREPPTKPRARVRIEFRERHRVSLLRP
jgi:hypothetical protein